MNIQETLDKYLGKHTSYTEKQTDAEGFKEVCDLETGDCYKVRMKDGLIERVDYLINKNKKVQVETPHGFKQLLND